MKRIVAVLTLFVLIIFVEGSRTQNRPALESWNWIIPLSTMKIDIEKTFGSSIDDDKTHPFQLYDSNIGRITVVFATEKQNVHKTACVVEKGTVLNFSVSPKRLNLSQLGYDLTMFKRDATFAPREITYFSEALGILIDTQIIESSTKISEERVIMILYHAPEGFCPKQK